MTSCERASQHKDSEDGSTGALSRFEASPASDLGVGQTRCDCTSLDNSLVAGRIIYGTLHCVRLLRAWAKHPSCGSSSFVLIQGENR